MTDVDWSGIGKWVRQEAHFAQVATVNTTGFAVVRTMGAPLNEDWTVDLIQRSIHRRLDHLRRNPRITLTWVGSPAPGSRNDQPSVFDYGWSIPRVVSLRGVAEFRDDDWTLRRYLELTAQLDRVGPGRAVKRTDRDVRRELVGIHIAPVAVRAEGFGLGAEAFTRYWKNNV